MHTNAGYLLEYLKDVPYLLPWGQHIVDYRRALCMNDTGAFLWQGIQEGCAQDALLRRMMEHFEAEKSDLPVLGQDLDQFLRFLQTNGISVETPQCFLEPSGTSRIHEMSEFCEGKAAGAKSLFPLRREEKDSVPTRRFRIGGLTLFLYGNTACIAKELDAFSDENASAPNLHVFFHEIPDGASSLYTAGKNTLPVLHTDELVLTHGTDGYAFSFLQNQYAPYARLSTDGTQAAIAYRPGGFLGKNPCAEEIFHILRMLYLYTAQLHGCFALHSVSILYQGKAWLISGSSGMGKSTHAAFWKEQYGTPLINGDLNLIRLHGTDGACIHGIPWCGTSGISDTHTYPLGGILLLGRSDASKIIHLTPDKRQLAVTQRLISPAWTPEQLRQNLRFTDALTERIPVAKLLAAKDPNAATVAKKWMDRIPLS